ncbi:MAG: neutral/alkaline non-lysosomal ceramidase N-terminal domain-containing protein, partial [Thermoanaerobaculia bacterium]|nr:neutral/alkaline non-lysosomal ceramidase N-terminal domain-containing protein [Thermoanaerobaculia bacterium]
MRSALLERIGGLGIGDADLLLTATHTHSGPAGFARPKIWQFVAADTYSQELFDRYVASMAAAVEQAVARLAPARLAIGSGPIEDAVRNRRDHPEWLDPTATVVRIDTPAGEPLAAVVHFAIHPTVLTEENLLLSADVAGSIVRATAAATGAEAIFLNGAEGDVSPTPPDRGPEGVAALGERIGTAAAAIWRTLEPAEVHRLDTVRLERPTEKVELNLAACAGLDGHSGKWMKELDSPYLSTVAPIAGLRIDDHAFVTVPGEPIVELGEAIEAAGEELGFAGTVVIGLTDDYLGYVLTEDEYREGGYEACGAWYGPRLGATILEGATAALRALAD